MGQTFHTNRSKEKKKGRKGHYKRTCEICHCEFNTKFIDKVACTPCTSSTKKDFGTADCKNCGEKFKKTTSFNVYCGEKCRLEVMFKRYRENKEATYFVIFERDEFTCVYCGKSSIEDGVKLVIDHVYPRSNGGENEILNLVTACCDCNAIKSGNNLSKETILRIWKRNSELNKRCEENYDDLTAEFNKIYGLPNKSKNK